MYCSFKSGFHWHLVLREISCSWNNTLKLFSSCGWANSCFSPSYLGSYGFMYYVFLNCLENILHSFWQNIKQMIFWQIIQWEKNNNLSNRDSLVTLIWLFWSVLYCQKWFPFIFHSEINVSAMIWNMFIFLTCFMWFTTFSPLTLAEFQEYFMTLQFITWVRF